MPLKLITFAFIIVVLIWELSYSETSYNLLQLYQDSTLIISSPEESIKIPGKKWIGDVSLGILFDRKFYTMDFDKKLLITDLKLMKTESLLDFQKIMDVSYRPFSVQYVDDNKIIIEAYTYDKTQHVSKASTFYLFQYDRRAGDIQKMPISIDRGPISLHKNRMYYKGKDGYIYCHDGNADQSLGIKGDSPTISPDGTRLAYIASGTIRSGIYLYDFETRKVKSVINYFSSINPIIRWSGDSHLLAIHTKSDISLKPLYIVDASTGRIIREYKDNVALNWFFIEGNIVVSP